jgi:exoribonuclease II
MNVFYEEDGEYKAGTVIEDNNTSLQIQTQHGKRAKLKSSAVLLRFQRDSLNDFMKSAHAIAGSIDADFLWEACGPHEFGFQSLGREYFGHEPGPEEAAGLLIRLHGAPAHFYRKGRGQYRPAPPEALKAARASMERKRRQQQMQADYVAQLRRFELPEVFHPMLRELLYRPDRNTTEYKALEAACLDLHLSVPRLLEKCGALVSPHEYHLRRFLFEMFPRGTAFDPALSCTLPGDLPHAQVRAFSVDDASTTEIDDAFSVTRGAHGSVVVGIHIAAPALGIPLGSALDREAARRMSTVYFPGAKITMLPDAAIETFSLAAGGSRPALSLYLDVSPTLDVVATRTAVEAVPIHANLRLDRLESSFNEDAVENGRAEFPYGDELLLLHRLALRLEQSRGKPETAMRYDFSFRIEGERVHIVPRKRGSPIDKVVSELMIQVNSAWARMLSEAGVSALYRVQSNGKVRISTVPAVHQGLGVQQYVWASSPLRRYADLVNQRQLLAVVRNALPPYATGDERLLAALRDFEVAYEAYGEFQRRMERYWCLRWLLQEAVATATGEVVRDDVVRLEAIPLFCRTSSLPTLPPGTRVEVVLSDIDLMELSVRCEYRATLATHEAAQEGHAA